MKRRFAAALMACLMAVALVVPANAVQTRAAKSGPRLYFTGTTATCEFVHTNHKCRYRGVVGEMLDIPCYFLDEFVQRLEFVGIGSVVGYCEVVTFVEECPEFLE